MLITHLHEDHYDPEAVIAAYGTGIPVYVPAEMAADARAAGFTDVRGMSVGDSDRIGDEVQVTSAPSVDGIGDVQVSWIVEGEGRRVIHCGDTLWHGYWWSFARTYGPFDAAFLPVNGAVMEVPGMTPSGQPICLTPEQAVAAATVLGAERLVPIHYGTMQHPPIYRETPDIAPRLAKAADGKVRLCMLKTTEKIAI